MRQQPERTDGQLLSAVAEDPQAFLEIFERHFDVVHRFLARQLGSAAAEDAAADVFLRALRGAASFAPDVVDARPWLFGIAANVIRAELRDRYRDQPQSIDSVETLETGRDEAKLEAVGQLAEVQKALDLIPIDEREPLLLFAWLDLSYEEIATALGLPIGTVRSRIARARRRLRASLGLKLFFVSDGTYDG